MMSKNSNDNKNDKDDDNVVPLKRPAKPKRAAKSPTDEHKVNEPLFNLPPYTQYLLMALIAIHLVITFILTQDQVNWVYIHLGFIPGRFTGAALFEPLALITPFTHLLIHGGTLHLAMNAIMLLAFGSGVERWMGGKKMIAFFVVCCVFGIAAHMALNFNSIAPVIGASGGLSGLFAAAIIMINERHQNMNGRYGIWPFVALWIGISILFGTMGEPDGSNIAWAAHVGGFLGGFATLKWMKIWR